MTHLVVGTPMYGGMCHQAFAESVQALQRAMNANGNKCSTIYVGNESLIPRARNAIVWHFLQNPETTHLLFCDADQKFRAVDVLEMILFDKPIIVGAVPMKMIDWDSVYMAAHSDKTMLGDDLARFGARFNFNEFLDTFVPGDMNPIRVARAGAGFMLIKREVFEKLSFPTRRYSNDTPGIPYGAAVCDYFPAGLDGARYLSEDFGFCELAKYAGYDIWLAPAVEISHFGTFEFVGSLAKKYG